MRNPHGFSNGKPFRYELPKPEPIHQRFDFIESVNAVKGIWLLIAVVVVVLVAVIAGVELI